MKSLLVFDHSNDIIYTKYNQEFAKHIKEFGKSQGFIPEEEDNLNIANDVLVQIFAPLVTSQRIMCCQFGNSYNSIQGTDNINFAFEEYMGYLFINIGNEHIAVLRKALSVSVVLIRYICGPDIRLLKHVREKSHLVSELINSWEQLESSEQLMLVEAVEQLVINRDLSAITMEALKEAVGDLQHITDCSRVHSLVFVQNKFLGLYSSKSASTLSPADILFLVVLGNLPIQRQENVEFQGKLTVHALLSGNDSTPTCTPHLIHITPLNEGVNLFVIFEVGNPVLSCGIYETFLHLNAIQIIQMQQDVATLKPALENLEIAVKKLHDGVKKSKNSQIDMIYKSFGKKWDFMRKKYLDFIKHNVSESLLRAESCTSGLLDSLKELLQQSKLNKLTKLTDVYLDEVASRVNEKLVPFGEFLQVKALRNFTLGSDSLTINKYLEEFPGLVHFLYVDRSSHRLTTPTLDPPIDEASSFTRRRVWSMVKFARSHLQEGHLAIIWKDKTFTCSYFVWFEDSGGTTLKPTVVPTKTTQAFRTPGVICGDFYRVLKEVCFPKMSANKLRCYELFLIHLGLVTPPIVLEQTRRLAATICEIRGHPHNSIDLL